MLHDLRGHLVIVGHDMTRHFAEQLNIDPDAGNIALIQLLNRGLDFLAGYNDAAVYLIMAAAAEIVGILPWNFSFEKQQIVAENAHLLLK